MPPSSFTTLATDIRAALFEFTGTTFFLLLGLGGIQAAAGATARSRDDTSSLEQVLYVSTCMGLSLLASAWLFFRITGGLFNPNVSLALFLVGAITPVRFVLYALAQLIGGIVASALVLALTPGPLASNTFLQKGINPAQGVFIEMFITTALVLSVLMLAAEKHSVTPFAPIGIGLTLFAAHLFAVNYTGAAMNTARAFGPAVVTGFPYHRHWVYWVGPFLGSLLGSAFYALLKHYQYWRLNPDQAAVEADKSPPDPVGLAKVLMSPRLSLRPTAAAGVSVEGREVGAPVETATHAARTTVQRGEETFQGARAISMGGGAAALLMSRAGSATAATGDNNVAMV